MSSLFGIGGGGNVGAAGGGSFYSYSIQNSLRFDEGDSAYLTFTPSSNGTDNKKYTFSVWIKLAQGSGDFRTVFSSKNAGSGTGQGHNTYAFGTDDDFELYTQNGGANPTSPRLYRDRGAWYHFLVVYDTTQSTDTDRVKVYVNGTQQTDYTGTFPGLNSVMASVNTNGQEQRWGRYVSAYTRYFNGYMAEIHMVDGQALSPTDFAEEVNGIWVPKQYTDNGTTSHGVNGYHLTFEGTGTATTTQGTTAQTNIGDDQSGNGNNFSVSGLAASDVVPDSPSGNNFATLNPLAEDGVNIKTGAVLSEGNLVTATAGFGSGTPWGGGQSTIAIPTDKKIYCEMLCSNATGSSWFGGVSIPELSANSTGSTNVGQISAYNRSAMINGVETDYGSSAGLGGLGIASLASGDIFQIAVDGATGKVWFGRNGTYFKSPSTDDSGTTGDPAAGTHEIGTVTNTDGKPLFIVVGGGSATVHVNFGQDSSFAGQKTSGSAEAQDANGIGDFYYAPPTDYVCLAASSLSEPTIGPNSGVGEQADDYFNTVLYTGNSGTNAITGVGFQPDFVWAKSRTTAYASELYDVIRGQNRMYSSATTADAIGSITSFDSDGFTHTSGSIGTNASGDSIVAWNWKAGGTAVSNTDGTNITSSVSAAPDAGFSVVSWTGTGVGSDSVGHGLTQKPDMVICKARTSAGVNYWHVNHKDLTASDYNIFLNLTSAESDVNTNYSEGGIGLGDANVIDFVAGYSGANNVANCNNSGSDYIAYCFHSVDGYSRVTSYVGNASTDGTFCFLGHRPAWIMLKNASASSAWYIFDVARNTYNAMDNYLRPNLANAEGNLDFCDFTSNGFKIRSSAAEWNGSGNTIIVLSFAEQPFKYANAR